MPLLQIARSVQDRSTKGALSEPLDSARSGLTNDYATFIISRATLTSKSCPNAIVHYMRRFFLEDIFGEILTSELGVN